VEHEPNQSKPDGEVKGESLSPAAKKLRALIEQGLLSGPARPRSDEQAAHLLAIANGEID
jgi:hypothetical protein